jgi:hypothetical protein
MKPFHLSFVVPDKVPVKEFYLNTLGCSLGRDTESWFDILFFEHQLTVHQASDQMPAYKIDHFGPVLDKETWLVMAERCKTNKVNFLMKPSIKEKGGSNESGKFLIADSAGNVLEFKYYLNFKNTVG